MSSFQVHDLPIPKISKKNPPATFNHANKQLTNVDEISTTTKDVISPLNV